MKTITCRLAGAIDAPGIVALFSRDGNPFRWSLDKWRHYYADYPEGAALGVVALDEGGQVVGHNGMQPVQVGPYRAMRGMHTYVAEECRDLTVISAVMDRSAEVCAEAGFDFMFGFSNDAFARVSTTLLGWRTLGYLRFVEAEVVDLVRFRHRLRPAYSEAWSRWKFGSARGPFIKSYTREGRTYNQLLHSGGLDEIRASDLQMDRIQYWSPDHYSRTRPDAWCQGVQIRSLRKDLDESVFDIHNWMLEMGDSDTFEVRQW